MAGMSAPNMCGMRPDPTANHDAEKPGQHAMGHGGPPLQVFLPQGHFHDRVPGERVHGDSGPPQGQREQDQPAHGRTIPPRMPLGVLHSQSLHMEAPWARMTRSNRGDFGSDCKPHLVSESAVTQSRA